VQVGTGTHQRAADLLLVLAALTLFFTVLFVGYGLWERHTAGQPFGAQTLFATMAQLVGGMALGAFFLALSWVLRILESLTRALDRFRSSLGMLASGQTPREARPMPPNFVSPDTIRQVRELLEEIRDYSLMTPEQKQGRWDR
jgi:hypothetical protein